MDDRRFDNLVRGLAGGGWSRRGLARALSGAVLALLLGWAPDAAAKKERKAKSEGKGKKGKGKGKGKKKGRNPSPPPALIAPVEAPPPSPPPPPEPPAPTCSDFIKNGNEADIDCGGGTCPRCALGKSCTSRDDCRTAFCSFGACEACSSDGDCDIEGTGACFCAQPETGGPKVCTQSSTTIPEVNVCTSCPADTVCLDFGKFLCFKRCGAP